MVSQVLYGESFDLLEEQNTWKRIRLKHDGYEGWLEHSETFPLSTEVRRIALSVPGTLEATKGLLHLQPGSLLSEKECEKSAIQTEAENKVDIIRFAQQYLGSPYLWGGRTMQGIDCSGFIQLIGRFANITLPRDAYQQAECGNSVKVDEAASGDVAFFKNEKGRITHVGMLLSPTEIIHASEWVRVDSFSPAGIIRRETSVKTHTFSHLQRIF